MSLNEVVSLFIEGKKEATKRTYLSLANSFQIYLLSKGLTLNTVQPIHVKEFLYHKKSMNTASTFKKFLCALFNFIGKKDLAQYMKKSLKEIKDEERFAVDLTPEEILKLINMTPRPEYKFAYSCMAFDGLRPGEILGLCREDIDLEKKQIILRRREDFKYGPKGMKPGDKPETVPMNPLSMDLFKWFKDSDGRLLPVSYKTMRKWFVRHVKEAGITRENYPITPHKLRHFFGHYWTRNKGNIRILKEVMRHSKIEYTLLYTQPSEEEIREEFFKVITQTLT